MEFRLKVPGYEVPESMTFAHSTRLADAWRAIPERIYEPTLKASAGELVVRVFEGNTEELGYKRPTRNPLRKLRRRQILDMSGKYVFDTRNQIDTNMGHYLVDDIARLLAARRRLSDELGEEIEIHAVLKDRPTRMALEIFEALGIPVVTTEAQILGRIVQTTNKPVETWCEGKLAHKGAPRMIGMLPEIYSPFQPQFQHGGPRTPEKIFISRKGSRTIENEQEISDLLASHGFQKYYFEIDELPVREQWRIIGNAREIVAIHGAGLTSLVLNPNGLVRPRGDLGGLRIIELHGAGYFVDFNRRLAAVMNAHWCGVRGRITPEIIRDIDRQGGRGYQGASFHVDPVSLDLALKYSASACPQPTMAVT